MILVTSAAGGVGRPLVRGLQTRGLDVRAFVKSEIQAADARSDGAAEVVVGDLRAPQDLQRAMQGATQVYHAAPTQIIDEMPIAATLIAAAPKHRIDHFVFHSVIHPDIAALPHHHAKLLVEVALRDSGLPVTILRPSHYMQNYLEVWNFICAGAMPYPVSASSKMGVVDVEDVSEAAVRVLADPTAHIGNTYDLSAQELDRNEMAQIWSDVLGHRVVAMRLPPEAMTSPLAASGVLGEIVFRSLASTKLRAPRHVARGIRESRNPRGMRSWPPEARRCYAQMMAYYDKNGLPPGDMSHLASLLGRKPTTYDQFARRVAAARGVGSRS